MAEKKEIQFENIKRIGLLAGDDEIGQLLSKLRNSEKDITAIIRALSEKSRELISKRAEEEAIAARAAEEAEEARAAEEDHTAETAKTAAEAPAEPSEEIPTEETAEIIKAPSESEKGKKKVEKAVPREQKADAPKAEEKSENIDSSEKQGTSENPPEQKTTADRPSFIVKKASEAAAEEKAKKPVKKEYVPTADGKKDKKPYPAKPAAGTAPKKPGDKQVRTFTNTGDTRFAPPAAPQKDNKGGKKKVEKSFEDKKAVNKRALIKTQISVEDFDENKTGYRKLRTKKQKSDQSAQTVKIEKAVITTEMIPIKTLSEKIGVSAVEITKKLFKEGIIKTINDTIDYDTAAFIAADIGVELELKLEKTAEDVLSALAEDTADDESKLVRRPPVVTVMGHVDHGKTSLLDKIRSTNVTAGEAGGITQHIGAYTVSVGGNQITFIDTPGHAAFTAMRARGAQVTDIAIIVIAADDGIMPQTIEAINHAKAANVSIIVAANKIDKPTANIDRIRQQLTEHDILVEDWGGDVILAPVSAKTGEGIPELLDTIQVVAEMRDLKANPDRMAKGTIIEAKLDKGKGPLATVLIQNGTLKTGDNIVAGTVVGRVRAMIDDKGRTVKTAGPSMAVSILGLEEVPNAGDSIYAVEQEKLTKLVAQERKNKEREDMIRQTQRISLDDFFNKMEEGKQLTLNLIVKADVQGSVEAVKQSLVKLSNDEVKVSVIHAAVGAISETDVMLADSSNSVIIGFNVRPDSNAKAIAERQHIDVKLYKIIYEAIEDVQKAMKGMLAPKYRDVYTGKAEVRDTFNITGVGTVAGCYVVDGKIVRSGGKLRIYRNDILICEGNVLQLKRFKDDVKEVQQGFECGMSIENFNDIKIGDFIECYVTEEIKD